VAFDPISSILDVGKVLIEKLIPDPAAKAAATQKLLEMQQNGDLAVIASQTDINKIEAASPNMFVAGWRPACGWVCVLGLAVTVFSPLLSWGAALAGHAIAVPAVPMDALMTLLIGMLGLGGMRTVEKLQNAQGNH
jgi:hypothetical protein